MSAPQSHVISPTIRKRLAVNFVSNLVLFMITAGSSDGLRRKDGANTAHTHNTQQRTNDRAVRYECTVREQISLR